MSGLVVSGGCGRSRRSLGRVTGETILTFLRVHASQPTNLFLLRALLQSFYLSDSRMIEMLRGLSKWTMLFYEDKSETLFDVLSLTLLQSIILLSFSKGLS